MLACRERFDPVVGAETDDCRAINLRLVARPAARGSVGSVSPLEGNRAR